MEEALLRRLASLADGAVPGSRWVMGGTWRDSVRRLEGFCGEALLVPGRDGHEFLFGLQVEIREDGGVPHLEPA